MWFSSGIADSYGHAMFNILKNRHTVSIAAAHFTFPPAMYMVPIYPHPS